MEACKITNYNKEIYYYLPDLNRFVTSSQIDKDKKHIKEEAESVNNEMVKIDNKFVEHLISNEANQLILCITDDCNMQCKYCINSGEYEFEKIRKKKHMSFETAKKALDNFAVSSKNNKDVHVSFYGGEPFMSPLTCDNIINVCDYAKQLFGPSNIKFSATSNGLSFNNEELIKKIIDNQIYLSISIDGPKEIHDNNRISNSKPTFNKIINNMQLIRDISNSYYDRSVSFICTIAGEQKLRERNEFYATSEIVKNHNLMVTFKNPFDQKSSHSGDSVIPIVDNENDFSQLLYEYAISCIKGEPENVPIIHGMYSKTISIVEDSVKRGTNNLGFPINGICAPGHRRIYVGTDGTYYICEKINSALPLGNVFSGFKIFDAIDLAEKYRNLSKEECEKCWARHLCDLCYVSARKGNSLDISRKKENCATKKAFLASALIIYTTLLETAPEKITELFSKNKN